MKPYGTNQKTPKRLKQKRSHKYHEQKRAERGHARHEAKTLTKKEASMINGHKYKLKYVFKPERGEFAKADLMKGDLGGSDALILFSLLYPEDGSFSLNFWTFDGRRPAENAPINDPSIGELDDNELFKVWLMLSKRLADSRTLSAPKRDFAMEVFQVFAEAMKKS